MDPDESRAAELIHELCQLKLAKLRGVVPLMEGVIEKIMVASEALPKEKYSEQKVDQLRRLPGVLLGRIWPPEQVVLGILVCKWMMRELVQHVEEVVLMGSGCGAVTPYYIYKSLSRLQRSRVSLRWWKPEPGTFNILFTGMSVALHGGFNQALVHLDLSDNLIGNEGAEGLAGVLGECRALTHLDLTYNKIGAEGVGWLATSLCECTSLQRFDLKYNVIGDEGVRRLAAMLGVYQNLAHLDLSRNKIGSDGAGYISRGLGKCKALSHFNISGNQIGQDGAERIAAALAECKALTHLNLYGNAIGSTGAGRLAEVLSHSKGLSLLDLRWNGIGPDSEAKLTDLAAEVKL